MSFLRSLLFVVLAVSPSIASPARLQPRATCNHDNLLRDFLDSRYSSSASQFCSAYIAATSTAHATTTPTTVVSKTPTAIATSKPTSFTSVTVLTTVTTISYTSTEVDTATITSTSLPPPGADRRDVAQQPSVITAPDNAVTFGASRLSSACSCLISASLTVTVTTTAIAPTFTSTFTAPTTTVTTTNSLVTSTIPIFSSVTDLESTTTTTIATSTSVVVAPTLCGNAGLQFGFYPDYYYNADAPAYSNFETDYLKGSTPEDTGVTTYVRENDSQGYYEDIYGVTVDPGYLVINHRGYLFAAETGTYSFLAGYTDDITLLWVGDLAYSGWTRSNANLEVGYAEDIPPFTIDLVAGNYYPIRIVWGNAQRPANFAFSITAPDGTIVLDGSTQENISIVQYSCDETTAPAFAPFGSET